MTDILLVDDSATDRVRIQGLLERRSGWKIQAVASATEGLELMKHRSFDLVLTDLQMPEINGLALLKMVGKEFPSVPVVVITGVGSEQLAVKTMKSGAAQYVCKTDAAGLIRESIERVLSAKADTASHQSVRSCMLSDSYQFCLENDSSLMSGLARFLAGEAGAIGVCQQSELPRLVIAIEEALLNACLHGNLELDSSLKEKDGNEFEALAVQRAGQAPYSDRHVTVDAEFSRERVAIHIQDEGNGFDPTSLPDPTDPENILKPHGRGVMMMRLFMDEVVWNDTGNEVRLFKKRGQE